MDAFLGEDTALMVHPNSASALRERAHISSGCGPGEPMRMWAGVACAESCWIPRRQFR